MPLYENMTLLDRYVVLRALGEGGMGAAYLVEDHRLGRHCVIKEVLRHDSTSQNQFEREARLLAGLRHPNLPVVYDYFFDQGRPYIVMQYAEGMTLDRLGNGRASPFEINDVLKWAHDLLDAVQYLHNQKPPIIHRDIKPSNICITPEDKAVLLDFGIARRLDDRRTCTMAQAQSVHYAPIEQYSSEGLGAYASLQRYLQELEAEGIHTGPYSDVYSLGATLYFALTLLHPPDACLRKVGEGLRPIREFNPDVPDFLVRALDRAMIVDPRKRCQTIAELLSYIKLRRYTAQINQLNPGCLVFLIDQSYSMVDPFGGGDIESKKAAVLAEAINCLLESLVERCTENGRTRRCFEVSIIGYGATVASALGGDLTGQELVGIDEIAKCARIEEHHRKAYDSVDGMVQIADKSRVWLDPVANGDTPLCEALQQAYTILHRWVAAHPQSFPPIVVNITDGAPTDGDPFPISETITELATEDGNVLFFNLHLASHLADEIAFPDSEDTLLDEEYARLLFQMSSRLTDDMLTTARRLGFRISDNARGFVLNAGTQAVTHFLTIGTFLGADHTEGNC